MAQPALAYSLWSNPADLTVLLVYLLAMLLFGSVFGRGTKTTHDFFFSGQRFGAWLISASFIATLVGSYSFIKYSAAGYDYGLSSTSGYLNDWFILPLFMFGWLPIIYWGRIRSVPEYFDRRYGPPTRMAGTLLILLYMAGYIGFNLFTLGKALGPLLGLDPMTVVVIVAVVCGVYVTAGGQTSVIMTDLAQGILLLSAGLLLVILGINRLGGWSAFWAALPAGHKSGLPGLTQPNDFNAVGLFWQDGMANSFAFYFMNQGVMMRFLSARSVAVGRKSILLIALVLMPITAVAVCGAGWIGAAFRTTGIIPPGLDHNDIFVAVSKILCGPGVFGLVVAALTAALMSTVDSLINAVSAIVVNDIYQPYIRPNAADRHYLSVARVVSVLASALGIGLAPLFFQYASVYTAHAAFTAAITPPLVIVILLGMIWRRFGGPASFCTIVFGTAAIAASFAWPWLIDPLSHGISGKDGYAFMRALYGLAVCLAFAVVFGLVFRRTPDAQTAGLTIWTMSPQKDEDRG